MQANVEQNEDVEQEVDLKELDNNKEEKRLTLVLEIEEKKFHHKIARRPVAWYVALLLFTLLLLCLAIAAEDIFNTNSYFSQLAGFLIFTFAILFIGQIIYFFLDYYSAGDPHGFRAIHRIKNLISLKEDIEELQVRLRILDEFITSRRPPQEKYQEELSHVTIQYQHRANHNRRLYYLVQIIIISCSLIVSGLTSGLNNLIGLFGNSWVTPVISLFVSFLAAMITLFRFRERGHNLQQTADAIEFESSCYKKGIYGYKNSPEKEAFTRFAEEVERLRNEQRKRQQQLEQSSETKQTTE
ncbi:MAG TPA: DUF4231 domain-containing protein [Methylomirabilota bacterium]|nr:DUF4231 domain-containing protein [Methylomirabilota bacterium]